jgi:hypothetical protein
VLNGERERERGKSDRMNELEVEIMVRVGG